MTTTIAATEMEFPLHKQDMVVTEMTMIEMTMMMMITMHVCVLAMNGMTTVTNQIAHHHGQTETEMTTMTM